MKTRTMGSLFFSALFAVAVAGCDETVSEKSKVESKPDGTTVEKKETVTKEADGDVKVEETKEVDRPGTANDESSTKTKEVEAPK